MPYRHQRSGPRPEDRPFRTFLSRVYERSADDNVFFLASGLTFSVVLAAIPFLLLLISLPGLLLGSGIERFQDEVLRWLWRILPVTTGEVQAEIRRQFQAMSEGAGSLGFISAVLFIWFSTRLFGALRTALGEVFDIEDTRGIVKGKITDVRLVLISTLLLSANIAASAFLGIRGTRWLEELGLEAGIFSTLLGILTPFLTVYVMFLLIYKFLPAKALAWRTAAVAALVAAVSFELLKAGFGWYIANFGSYASIFFAFTTVVILVLSIYYASILFLIGGEVAQAYDLHRIMKRQREIFD